MKRKRSQTGVTLIELMIVVVIVVILGAIAIPNYRDYSIRAQRTEAKSALLQLAANQERYYDQNGHSFTSTLADVQMPATTESDTYQLSIDAGADETTFTARARAINTMADDDECQVFTINAQGVRGAAPDTDDDCW